MNRQWIIGITTAATAGDSTEVHILSCLQKVEEKVEGDLVLCVVPSDETNRLLGEIIESNHFPIHLITPAESRELILERFPEASRLIHSAASINVQPGRGNAESDWKDCERWLKAVADIRLIVQDDTSAPDSSRECPTVYLQARNGEIRFDNFPDSQALEDPGFAQICKDIGLPLGVPITLDEVKASASATANRFAPRSRFLESASLLFNLSPSFLFGIGAAIRLDPRWLNVATFAAALGAALVALVLSRVNLKRAWLSSRAAAEACRSLIATRGILDPLFPPAASHLDGFESLSRSLALQDSIRNPSSTPPAPLSSLRDTYITKRIDGQLKHYSGKIDEAKFRARWLKRAFYLTTILAFVVNLAALLLYVYHEALPPESATINERWISGFAAWVFPSLAAAAIGLLAIHETSRRSIGYRAMIEKLNQKKAILKDLMSESSITETIRATEDMLLEEVGEWFRGQKF